MKTKHLYRRKSKLAKRKARKGARKAARQGYVKIIRRSPEMFITNSGVANTPVVVDTTGSCLQLGAPVANQWGTYDLPFSLQFMLSQLLNNGDITNLADKYRIKSAYVRIFFNSSNSSTGSLYSMPQLYHITDHDDSSPATPAQIRERMGVKYTTFKNASSYIGIRCNPVPAATLFNSAVSSGYEVPKVSPWINTAYPSVPHYGIKGILTNVNLPVNTTAQTGFKFDISLTLEAKEFQ